MALMMFDVLYRLPPAWVLGRRISYYSAASVMLPHACETKLSEYQDSTTMHTYGANEAARTVRSQVSRY